MLSCYAIGVLLILLRVVGQCIPPLVLVAPAAPVLLLMVPSDMLGKATTPLCRRRVAEPELKQNGLMLHLP